MRTRSMSSVVVACIALSGCAPTARVMIEKLDPPDADVSGISEIAVLPFGDDVTGSARGQVVAQHLAEVVANTGRYRVMKDDQMKSLLARAGIQFSYPPDASMVRRMGTALGVDALLYGELEKSQCDEESRAVEAREPVWTGDYVRDGQGNIMSDIRSTGESMPRKRFVKQLVEKNRLKRYAVLNLHVRMADAFLGNVICADTASESGSWEGTGSAEIAELPTCDMIFDLLLDRAIKKFVRKIAAHPVEEERILEYGIFHSTRLGVELAKNNLWDEAMEKWMQAIKAKPDDPAAYYDMGVGFERRGMFDLAYKAYQNALVRNTRSDRYIKTVARIQKLMKDLQ
ncbi:MAG: tetratricopeptide repeat protein [Candidatus Aureabacteria bacterium]|nr:tetratricopeptide repeat protein [Candidatus Auribacterota bacterium]